MLSSPKRRRGHLSGRFWIFFPPGAKWPGREVDQPPPSSAEVNNERIETSAPHTPPFICLHGADKEDFNFVLTVAVIVNVTMLRVVN